MASTSPSDSAAGMPTLKREYLAEDDEDIVRFIGGAAEFSSDQAGDGQSAFRRRS
jgi:hypothetical protein